MKNKHTLGPWHENLGLMSVYSADGKLITDMPIRGTSSNDTVIIGEERIANIKLIAAAPEMLECLKKIAETALPVKYAKIIVASGLNEIIKKADGE